MFLPSTVFLLLAKHYQHSRTGKGSRNQAYCKLRKEESFLKLLETGLLCLKGRGIGKHEVLMIVTDWTRAFSC